MLETLTGGVFAADMEGEVNSYRQNLQVEYVNMLVGAMNSKANGHNVRAAIFAQVLALADVLQAKVNGPDFTGLNAATRAHSQYLDFILRKALAVED